MKVCLLARFFDIKKNAGIARVATKLRDGLIANGIEVQTVSMDSESHWAYAKFSGWDLRNLPNADVYHALSPMEAMYCPPERTVVTWHDIIPLAFPKLSGARLSKSPLHRFLGSTYFRILSKIASRKKYLVATGQLTKEHMMKYMGLPESRVRVIELGISPELEPGPKPDDVFRIGYLGQLDRRKRVDVLINAFKDSGIDGELVIGGSGIDKPYLQSLVNGDNRIKFLGFVPDDELKDFYNSLDVFAFFSMIEGTGLPVLEAMACKIPVLILEDTIMPFNIKEKCFPYYLFSNTDVHLRKFSWVDDNYAFAKSFTWEKFTQNYIDLYKEVVR